jgi:hypothetical protein
MSWDSLVIVDDTDLGRFEPEAIHPDQPWDAASWPTQIEQAKRTLRVWVDADYADVLGASDRIRDRYAVTEAKALTGGAYTDIVTAAADATEEDIDLAGVYATPASDYVYLGAPWTFTGVFVHLLDSVNDATSALTVAYWAKNQWQSVPSQSDGTSVGGDTFAQSGRVTWGRITDWERRSLDGSDEGIYWVRLAVSATLTAGTAASGLSALRTPEGLRHVAAFLALGYIMRGLAAQSADPEEWRTRSEDYIGDARTLYDRLKATGGIPIDRDQSGAIDSGERGEAAAIPAGRMLRA